MTQSNASPFSLHNLLAAGTVVEELDQQPAPLSNASQCEDGWFSSPCVYTLLQKQTSHCLLFLEKNEYIRMTYSLRESRLVLRIYLVPFDLPGVRGRLRLDRRPVNVKIVAQQHLLHLISKLDQNQSAWVGDLSNTQPPRRILDWTPVRHCTIVLPHLTC